MFKLFERESEIDPNSPEGKTPEFCKDQGSNCGKFFAYQLQSSLNFVGDSKMAIQLMAIQTEI